MSRRINLRCFPTADRAFERRVEVLAEDEIVAAPDGPQQLQAILRELYYPAAVVSPRELSVDDEPGDTPTWYVFRDGSVVPAPTGPRRILVVDDDEAFVDMLRALLVQAGFAVQRARDGIEALDLAATFAPDVILLDLVMPRAGGEEFGKLYRQEPEPRAHIVLMSGRPEASVVALEIGARAVVPKPFEVEPLMELLQRYT